MDFVYPLLENKGEAKVVTFLHSGHEFLPGEDTSSVQINREYYSLFRNSDLIDVILVSTSYQKKELIESLEKYNCFVPRIECIPICGLDTLHYQDGKRKKKTLVSVSRIDRRKHIHWIMKAMIQAHEMDPEISLDVYGRGEKDFEDLLLDIQNQYQTQDYIHFKGQQNVREIYKQYPVFISASFWETMGLSLMEAVGSGNAIIGLNARYGNWEFIKDKENGIVVDFNRFDLLNPNIEEETVKKMAQAIVDIFKEENVLEQYKQKSYEIASHYLDDVVEKKWLDFIESLL